PTRRGVAHGAASIGRSLRGVTPVDGVDGAGDEGGGRRGEEADHGRDFVGSAQSANCLSLHHALWRCTCLWRQERRIDKSWCHGVHSHVVIGVFEGCGASQSYDAML